MLNGCDPLVGTTNYLYDGEDSIEEVDPSGNILARYTRDVHIDQPLVESRSSTSGYYEADGLGSVTSLSNSTAGIANTYAYDSFGSSSASGGTLGNPFRYTGREFDSETNVYYYRARYYDPQIGRFVGEDPIGFAGGINRYPYVSNRSLTFTDPLGLCPPKDPCWIPKHPWYVDVDLNIAESVANGPAFQFIMVLPHMPWDYKQQDPAYDDFGNFNFGATGAALGYPDEVLLRGAGALKKAERYYRNQPDPPELGSPFGDYPHGNEKDKQEMIKRGIDYYKHLCFLFLQGAAR